MYPELYIDVKMIGDDILIGIDSLAISNEVEYEAVILEFIKEYDRKGYADIYWGVSSYLTCDNLSLLEDLVKAPETESSKEKKVVNF